MSRTYSYIHRSNYGRSSLLTIIRLDRAKGHRVIGLHMHAILVYIGENCHTTTIGEEKHLLCSTKQATFFLVKPLCGSVCL